MKFHWKRYSICSESVITVDALPMTKIGDYCCRFLAYLCAERLLKTMITSKLSFLSRNLWTLNNIRSVFIVSGNLRSKVNSFYSCVILIWFIMYLLHLHISSFCIELFLVFFAPSCKLRRYFSSWTLFCNQA